MWESPSQAVADVLLKSNQSTVAATLHGVLPQPKMHVENEATNAQYMTCWYVQEFKLDDAKIWFIRMSLSARCNILACGNTQGQVYLWDMLALTEGPQAILRRGNNAKSSKIGRPNINSTVRTCVVLHIMCLEVNLWATLSNFAVYMLY